MSRSPASTPATTVYSDPVNGEKHQEESEELKGTRCVQDGLSSVCTGRLTLSSDPSYHALGLSSYIFNVGYMSQEWTDIQVVFFDQPLKLHRSKSLALLAGPNLTSSHFVQKPLPYALYAQLWSGS